MGSEGGILRSVLPCIHWGWGKVVWGACWPDTMNGVGCLRPFFPVIGPSKC